jgi:hypothetical protein
MSTTDNGDGIYVHCTTAYSGVHSGELSRVLEIAIEAAIKYVRYHLDGKRSICVRQMYTRH